MGRKNKKNAGERGESSKQQKPKKQFDFTDEELEQDTPPQWARGRGKAIGQFYRLKGIKKRDRPTDNPLHKEQKARCVVLQLDQKKQKQICDILGKISISTPPFISSIRAETAKVYESVEEKYKHIEESAFKKNFLRSIQGNVYDTIAKSVHNSRMRRNERLDNVYFEKELAVFKTPRAQEMASYRKKLPAASKRGELLHMLDKTNVLLISGETGCGKTTQIPQFILEDSIERKQGSVTTIICTQPRRISAISIAERVAYERCEQVGLSVGYQVRLERELPRESGSILFCTTGILLQLMRGDPLLEKVSHVILDEIHERDTLSDFVITLLKDIHPARPDLKIILMSATLDAENFSKYFNNCPVLHIPGFTFPVKEFYLEDVIQMLRFKFKPGGSRQNQSNNWMKKKERRILEMEEGAALEPYYRSIQHLYSRETIEILRSPESKEFSAELILELIKHICTKEGPGAILVFLSGWDRIKMVNKILSQSESFPSSHYMIIPLHSQMPTANQKQAFSHPPRGVRKIILATNIAETSITIDDVVFVIDSGKVKIKNFDIANNVSTLKEEWISCANARQRRGRAGRVQEGVCYHLYTKGRESLFLNYQLPEMLRTRLEEVILQAKILQLGKIAPFLAKVMDPPNPKAVDLSLDLLIGMNALDDNEQLTPLGFHLANLPVDPQAGKMILLGTMFSCMDPMYSIAASLSFKGAFVVPLGKEQAVSEIKKKIDGGQKSDHLIMAKVMYLWEQLTVEQWNPGRQKEFCYTNFLSATILEQLEEMKNSFAKGMYQMNYLSSLNLKDTRANIHSKNLALIKALICGSLYPNVAIITKCKRVKTRVITSIRLPENNLKVVLHPKSINEQYDSFESRFLVYFEKMRSASTFLFDSTMVYPLPLIFFCHKFRVMDEGEQKIIEINNSIRFICSAELAKLILELRAWLDWLLEYKVSHPGITDWSTPSDELCILSAITELLTTEHAMYQEGDDSDDDVCLSEDI